MKILLCFFSDDKLGAIIFTARKKKSIWKCCPTLQNLCFEQILRGVSRLILHAHPFSLLSDSLILHILCFLGMTSARPFEKPQVCKSSHFIHKWPYLAALITVLGLATFLLDRTITIIRIPFVLVWIQLLITFVMWRSCFQINYPK